MSIEIGDITPRIQYTAAAGQTVYTIPFPFYTETDLLVYSRAAGSDPDDAVDLLTLTIDYTVTGEGLASGGTITLVAASTANDIITIMRDMPEDRTSLYIDGGAVTAEALNADFSKTVMMNQQNELAANELQPRYDRNAVLAAGDLLMEQLPVGYAWRKNAAGTKIEAFLPSSATTPVAAPASALTLAVNQVAHGLVIGNVVYVDAAGDYIVARANAAATSEVVGIVSVVTDADNFTLHTHGHLTTGLAGLVAGTVYYLDPNIAGGLDAVRPTISTHFIKPLLVATSATTGIWLNYLGIGL